MENTKSIQTVDITEQAEGSTAIRCPGPLAVSIFDACRFAPMPTPAEPTWGYQPSAELPLPADLMDAVREIEAQVGQHPEEVDVHRQRLRNIFDAAQWRSRAEITAAAAIPKGWANYHGSLTRRRSWATSRTSRVEIERDHARYLWRVLSRQRPEMCEGLSEAVKTLAVPPASARTTPGRQWARQNRNARRAS